MTTWTFPGDEPPLVHALGPTINVVCTDRGQHPKRWIEGDYGADVIPSGRLHEFHCPRCGRNEQIRPERWAAIVNGLVALGHAELDISMIPHSRG